MEWWYGAAGKAYRDWCANFAESLNVGVPWIMCQQNDAPDPMVHTFLSVLFSLLKLGITVVFMLLYDTHYYLVTLFFLFQINTCNGYYCDQFTPKPNYPKMWTENWTGW